jgi:hypothetical protein
LGCNRQLCDALGSRRCACRFATSQKKAEVHSLSSPFSASASLSSAILIAKEVTVATTAKQRVIAILRGQEAKRIRFTAATATAGDITINHTTFAIVADAIEKLKIKVTVRKHFNPGVAAEYHPDAVPPIPLPRGLGAIPGFTSGELLVPPILGRDQEEYAIHECTHAFFDLQSINIGATEDEAICYVVDALYARMTGLPPSRRGTARPIYQASHDVARGLLHHYQLGDVAVPKVDDTAFKILVLAVAIDPTYFSRTAGLIHWFTGDNRYTHDG